MGMTDKEFTEQLKEVRSKAINSEKCITRWDMCLNLDKAIERLIEIGRTYTPDFVIDKNNEFVYVNILKWIHGDRTLKAINPDNKKQINGNTKAGIYIAGPPGTGKTMCLNVIRDYSFIIGAKVLILPFDEKTNLAWQNYNASEITDKYMRDGNIQEFECKRILCIHDFGCEPAYVSYMGNNINVLKLLIERRGDFKNRITLMTSNLSLGGKMLLEKYGERAVSRLYQMCNYYELKGDDRRKIK